ncbi:hypothetical protein [Janibacter terrae]|uniref:hypothetical protein n=1 Tax=Janibacter terrae TaxID=103817 RepID=UPI0031F845E8
MSNETSKRDGLIFAAGMGVSAAILIIGGAVLPWLLATVAPTGHHLIQQQEGLNYAGWFVMAAGGALSFVAVAAVVAGAARSATIRHHNR